MRRSQMHGECGLVVITKSQYEQLKKHMAYIRTGGDSYSYYYTSDYTVHSLYDYTYLDGFPNNGIVSYCPDHLYGYLIDQICQCGSQEDMLDTIPFDFTSDRNKEFLEINFDNVETDDEIDEFCEFVEKVVDNKKEWTPDEILNLEIMYDRNELSWEDYLRAADYNCCSTFSKEFKADDGTEIVVLHYATLNHVSHLKDTGWKIEWDRHLSEKENLDRIQKEREELWRQ